ncbi:stage II sporulation protein D [Desmospora sp. 8437]|nr:stage II sporulation protein D [Desmospora sp. 8437]
MIPRRRVGLHKGMILILAVLIGVMVAVPAALVSLDRNDPSLSSIRVDGGSSAASLDSGPGVKVYLSKEKKVETFPMERYIRGVVAAEMPVNFHPEALKAQALAARTYIVDRLSRGDFSDMAKWGKKAGKANVSDTVNHQVFLTDKQLKEQWGDDYETYSARINQAVVETAGQVIQYQGKPIYAAFFSTSNGKTENSEDYFAEEYPYLRSVPSPWDEASPKYRDRKQFAVADFVDKISRSTGKQVAVEAFTGGGWLRVTQRTAGGSADKVQVGDQVFTGRQIREALHLSSADFTFRLSQGTVTVETKGYGHGVGMSQWGANFMAKQGKSAKEIIRHYYRGVEIGSMDSYLKKE